MHTGGLIVHLKHPKPKPIAKMVIPGRRALGEKWQEVTIAIVDDEPVVFESRPVEAPPNGKPIHVPAMGNLSMEAVDFLLEGARKSQEYGLKHPSAMNPGEYAKWIQEQWLAFVENKMRWFKGQSTFGPGGHTQREKPGRTHWTGVNR